MYHNRVSIVRPLSDLPFYALPVKYFNQTSAWMSSEVFKDWFFNEFVPETEKFLKNNNLPQKAVLLLDTTPSRLRSDKRNSTVLTK